MSAESPTAPLDVLVVGGGPTGLTLACDLARRDVAVEIIDAAKEPPTSSRGKGVQPRTLEVFDDLEILPRILANGRSRVLMRSWRGHTQLGTRELNTEVVEGPERPYDRTMVIPQTRVEHELRSRLHDLGCEVGWGTRLTGLTEDADGVTATVCHAGRERTLRARWVIGCDGAHSTVRRLAGVSFLGATDVEDRVLSGDLILGGLDRDHWHLWPQGTGRVLSLCPLPATDLYQLTATVGPDYTQLPTLDDARETIRTMSGRDDIEVHAAPWLTVWSTSRRMVDRYRVGRLLVAGDAAHIHSPAGAVGMNTGIQDAYNLGWKLSAVLRGAPAGILDTYVAERLPVAARMLGLADQIRATIGTDGPRAGRGNETYGLDLNYRGGPLAPAVATDAPGVHAGDRAPDGVCTTKDGSRRRLFDVLRGPHATVLSFHARPPEGWDLPTWLPVVTASVAAKADAAEILRDDVLIDPEGRLATAYGVTRPTTFVIRPDGYVLGRWSHTELPARPWDLLQPSPFQSNARRSPTTRPQSPRAPAQTSPSRP